MIILNYQMNKQTNTCKQTNKHFNLSLNDRYRTKCLEFVQIDVQLGSCVHIAYS